MADYNFLETYNALEETMNFGSRSLADGHLYEACTLVTLRSEEKTAYIEPYLRSMIVDNQVYLVVNQRLTIFSDFTFSEVIFNEKFSNFIDCISITDDSKLILICLRDGGVQLLNLDTMEIVFAKNIAENLWYVDPFFVECFIEQYNETTCTFLAVDSKGKIYRITNILSEDTEEDLTKNTSVETLTDLKISIKCASYLACDQIMLVNGGALASYNIKTDATMRTVGLSLKYLRPYKKQKFMGLSNDGKILLICKRTLLSIESIVDEDSNYVRMALCTSKQSQETHILSLSESSKDGYANLKLFKFPGHNDIFDINLSGDAHRFHLIRPESAHDDCIYLNNGGADAELLICSVYETKPEQRLQRLLRRERFEEAEQFAREHGLPLTEVWKARAQSLANEENCTTEQINQLLEILDKIGDLLFKLNICADVTCEQFDDLRRVLTYGCSIDHKQKLNSDTELVLSAVISSMHHFDTFMELKTFSSDENYDMQYWSKFTQSDFFSIVKELLYHRKIDEAIIIYSRMKDFENITSHDITNILKTLDVVPDHIYRPFLYTFIPITLANMPHTLSTFVSWLRLRVYQFESKESDNFPENAQSLVQLVVELFRQSTRLSGNSTHVNTTLANDGDSYEDDASDILERETRALAELVDVLHTIETLKNNHDISIPLIVYGQQFELLIQTFFSLNLDTADYEEFLKEFLIGYLIKKKFDPDMVFLTEIKRVLRFNEQDWRHLVPAIVHVMSSLRAKLEAVLLVLECAMPPWHETVRALCNEAITWPHPLAGEVLQVISKESTYQVLKNPVYGNTVLTLRNLSDFTLITRRIIFCNQPTMMKDIYTLCKNNQSWINVGNYELIMHFLELNDVDKVLSIIDSSEGDNRLECCKKLLSTAAIYIEDKFQFPIKTNLYGILLSILDRLRPLVSADIFEIYERKYEDIVTILTLRTLLPATYGHIKRSTIQANRQSLITNALMNMAEGFDRADDVMPALERCVSLAECLHEPLDDFIRKLCENVAGDLTFMVPIAQYLLDNYIANIPSSEHSANTDKNLCLVAMLLLRGVGGGGSAERTMLTENNMMESFCVDEEVSTDIDLNLKALRMAHELAISAHNHILSVEVLNWTFVSSELTREYNSCKTVEKFQKNTFHSKTFSPTEQTFNSIRHVFDLYTGIIVNTKNPNTQYLTRYNSPEHIFNMSQFSRHIQHLPLYIQSLWSNGHHFTAWRLLDALKLGLFLTKEEIPEEILQQLDDLIKRCLRELIRTVFLQDNIDIDFAYALLIQNDCTFTYTFIHDSIATYKRVLHKVKLIAELGLRLTAYYKQPHIKDICTMFQLRSKWMTILSPASVSAVIPFKDFYSLSADAVLRQLITARLLDLRQVKEFCADSGLIASRNGNGGDGVDYYQYYLQTMLFSWRPTYKVKEPGVGGDGDRKRRCEIVPDDSLAKVCMEVATATQDKSSLFHFIHGLFSGVNFYYYEVFLCLIHTLDTLNNIPSSVSIVTASPLINHSDHRFLLNYLLTYTRRSGARDAELEEWHRRFPSQPLDPLAEWRLPFNAQVLFSGAGLQKVLRCEVNLETYSAWLMVVHVLREHVTVSDVCCYAIKDVVSTGILKSESNILTEPQHADLFVKIEECVQHITNLEEVTNVLYNLTLHTPSGADQLLAIQLCHKYAVSMLSNYPNTANITKAFIQVENKYRHCHSLQILHKYQLATENYISLISDPHELIEALYNDKRILENSDSIISDCPDINSATREIASIHSLDYKKVLLKLVDNWLFEVNVTKFNQSDLSSNEIYLEGLKRACYLCKGDDLSYWQEYFIGKGILVKEETSSNLTKARALKCLYNISSIENFEFNSVEISYIDFKHFVDKLFLLSDLECLGYVNDVENLDKENKFELLKRLTKQTSPASIKVMASICTTYSIHDFKCWDYIMTNMIKFDMIKELKESTKFLNNQFRCQYKPFYIKAWQTILDHSFRTVLKVPKEKVEKSCIENILMIQMCPSCYQLDYQNVLNILSELKLWHFVVVVLQFADNKIDTKRDIFMENVVNYPRIDEVLDELHLKGILVSYAKKIICKY